MKKKLIAIYIVLLIVGILIAGLLSLKLVNKSYENIIVDKLKNQANLIQQMVILKHDENQKINYHRIAQDFADKNNIRVTFIQTDGQVLADSFDNTIMFENYNDKPEIQASLQGNFGVTKRYSEVDMQNMIYVTLSPIEVDKRVIIRVATNMDDINRIDSEFFKNIFISAFITIIIMLIIGYVYIDKIVKPIKELSFITTEMAKGNFDKKVNVHTGDELEELSKNFNFMASSLNKMLSKLKYKNLELKSTLTSMTNGMMSINNSFNVIFINSSMKKMLGLNEKKCTGRPVKDIIECQELFQSIIETVEDDIPQSFEITLGNDNEKILKIFTSIIKEHGSPLNKLGILVTAEDVTEVRKLEKMRTDFVANVSHELKTPLTVISGFVETLQNRTLQDEEKRNKFLGIINSETERLKHLVDDLLDLSKIETSNINGSLHVISVYTIVNQIKNSLFYISSKKNISIYSDVPTDLNISNVNAAWFEQMIFNIVDNSLKYTQEGGYVKIFAYKDDYYVYISVEDDGIGIPKEDLPRIFERFYRVDKARSRKAGGTGLGLAIVKHISILMGGSIEVESEVNKGSKFVIKIPISQETEIKD